MNSYVPRTIVGAQIAGGDLRVAVVRSGFGKKRLVSSFVVEGFVGMSSEERVAELVKMTDRHALDGSRIFLSLPASDGVVRELEFPLEIRERLPSAVELQVESLSPWPGEEIYWDMSWKDPDKKGKSLFVNVSILTRDRLDPWIELFRMSGLPLSGVTLSTLSVGHAATVLWPDVVPTLVIGVESEYVEGCLVHADRVHSVSLSESGPAAERAGKVIHRLSSLARTSDMERVRTVAHGSERGDLDEDNPPLPLEGARGDSGGMFGSLGAAFSGLGESPFAVNLVPPEQRFRSNRLQFVPTLVMLMLLIVAASVLIVREPYQFSNYGAALDSAVRDIAPRVRDLTDQEAELNALSEKYRVLSAHLQGGDQALETLRELVRVLPSDTWLSAFSLREGTATINGFSSSASEIQRLIEESSLFAGAEFTNALTRDDSGRDRFTLRFENGGGS